MADAGLLRVRGTVVGTAIKGTPCVTGYRLILPLLTFSDVPRGVVGVFKSPPHRNSEGPSKIVPNSTRL